MTQNRACASMWKKNDVVEVVHMFRENKRKEERKYRKKGLV